MKLHAVAPNIQQTRAKQGARRCSLQATELAPLFKNPQGASEEPRASGTTVLKALS